MVAPVIAQLSRSYPNDEFVVVALKPLADLFYGLANVRYVEVSPDVERLQGLCRLSKQIMAYQPTQVFDLQDDFRTHLLRLLLRWHNVPVRVISSVSGAQRALLHRGYEQSEPLKPEIERYTDTFREGGLIPTGERPFVPVNPAGVNKVRERFGDKNGRWIGLAPFAKHMSNVLPYKTMKTIIGHFAQQPDTRIFLFGAGHIEAEMLRQWASLWPKVESVSNQLSLDGELELMRQIDGLLCMDSANQHLAALVDCPTLSIWCGTHTHMGFAAWNKPKMQILSLPISCRPCTVHGVEYCKYRNFACKALTPEIIIERFDKMLNNVDNKQVI